MRVLIVEDDAIMALHLQELVAGFGHEPCAIAATAAQAIGKAEESRPDVVLMDVRLAYGDSGVDAARELKQRHALRCIFVSGNLDDRTVSMMLPLEPVDFVLKPVVPVYLKRALEKAEAMLAIRQ